MTRSEFLSTRFYSGMQFRVIAGPYLIENGGPYTIDSVDFLEDQIGLKINENDPPYLFHYASVEAVGE